MRIGAWAIAMAGLAACGEPPPAASPPFATAAAEPESTASAESAPPPAASGSAAPVSSAKPEEPPLPAVELAPVAPAASPDPFPVITISAPTKNQVIATAKARAIEVKLGVKGWDLAPGGNHLCVRLDRHPCKRITDAKKKLTLEELDPTIDDGQHVLTVFARRGSGESVKPAGKRAAFASLSFFVGKKSPPVWKDGGPMLFVEAPDDGPPPPEGVLLDFYVAGAEVGKGRTVIHASVGGPGLGPGTAMVVDALAPLRLKNARPGEYIVKMSLFGYQHELGPSASSTTVSVASVPVAGPFSEVTRSFRVTN